MNDAHLHLLVNHLPIVGSLLSVPLIALALWRRERGAMTAAVLALAFTGLGAGAALWTGEPAEEFVEHRVAGVDEGLVHEHEERAEVATALAALAAAAGIGVLALGSSAPKLAGYGLLALSIASAGGMAWTGASGGPIRHDEIRAAAPGVAHSGDADEGSDEGDDEDEDHESDER